MLAGEILLAETQVEGLVEDVDVLENALVVLLGTCRIDLGQGSLEFVALGHLIGERRV